MTSGETARAAPGGGRPARALAALALLLAASFAFLALRVLAGKSFGLDEFTYAHAGWSIAQGLVPYRDFVFHHTPLVEQWLGLAFRVLGDDPTAIRALRWLVLPGLLLTIAATTMLAARRGAPAAAAAPFFLLAFFPVATMGVEIRPEAAATGLVLAAALVLGHRWPARGRAVAAGALVGVAVWTSEKTLAFGAAFAVAWLLDLAVHRRRGARCLTGDPGMFAGGFALALTPAALWLVAADAGREFLFWCGRFPFLHERFYPGHPWTTYFTPVVVDHLWIWPFAAIGVADALRRVRTSEHPATHPLILPLGLLITTWASFAVQRAAYPYSLIPWLAVTALFAAFGFAAMVDRAAALGSRGARALGAIGLGAILVLGAVASARRLERRLAHDNRHQLEVLAALDRLVAPGDPVYDNSGSYVARPHTSPTYFTDRTLRRLLGPELGPTQAKAIVDAGCTAFLRDYRTRELPPDLQAFLTTHFQPWNGDLGLWGMRYEQPAGAPPLTASFRAVRAATYFVDPPEILARGTLRIGEREIREPSFRLAAGEHPLRYEGDAATFHVLWLPADGDRWTPRPGPARFSVVF